ncbi:hypothetical protein [Pseudomonas sihuiensis]|uniref:hypothetical protein n=1 Tax=Pseudomonas sihuiensis TaxID=1274359 RepID=UPI0012FD1F00|nr:hypothetical protein [Pseudomonas sihuiensis]
MITFESLLFIGWLLTLCSLFLLDVYRIFGTGQKPLEQSPPASVTGYPGLPDRTAQSPPVAGDGGETG